MLTIENRAGVDVLVMRNGCRPATEAESAFYAELTRLRAEVEALRAAPQQAEPVPSVWQIESVYTSFYEGADCQTFKKREPEIVPATIADVTGGPWNPAPTAPALHTCGSCTWWNPRSADKRTGSCEFPVLTPASSPYPVDKTPMHETEGDDCRCFERKEG